MCWCVFTFLRDNKKDTPVQTHETLSIALLRASCTPSSWREMESLTALVTVASLWLDRYCLGQGLTKGQFCLSYITHMSFLIDVPLMVFELLYFLLFPLSVQSLWPLFIRPSYTSFISFTSFITLKHFCRMLTQRLYLVVTEYLFVATGPQDLG